MCSKTSSVRLSMAGCALVGLGLLAWSDSANAAVAQRTLLLQATQPVGAGLNVTWDPNSQQYYTAGTGSGEPMFSPVFTYSSTGTVVDVFPAYLEHDLRSINYNSNSNKLELMTFTARDGGVGAVGGRDQGLFEALRDASGLPTGSTSVLLGSLPGNRGRQTMPVYDAGRNEFYSFSNTNVFNRVSRADGSFLGNITLDTAPIGDPGFSWFASGYDQENDLLVVTSPSPVNKAFTFRLDGTHVGTWDLDIDVGGFYGTGFANGQLFVYDNVQQGWQGYSIPSPASLSLLGIAALVSRRRR
jgi:hypothetical protein